MPSLIDTNGSIQNIWSNLDNEQAVGTHSHVVVCLARLRDDWDSLEHLDVSVGVRLKSDEAVNDVLFALAKLQLIILQFPVFSDGRAFSQAKLLRDRHGFTGYIRATGDVLQDQLSYMKRAGFDQFEIADSEDIQLALSAFNEITIGYQSDIN